MLIFALLSGQISALEFFAIIFGILFGVTIHEYAHAFIAFRNGDPTAKYEGRLSLNPLVHLDAIGTISLLLVGFGWGKPVPINPSNFNHKSSELKVAFAGIIANLIIAFLLALPIRFANMNGQLFESSSLLLFLEWVVQINLVLAVFNLIPLPPLDGSHLVEAFLSHEQKYYYRQIGPSILLGVIILGIVTRVSIFSIIVEPVVRFLSAIIEGSAYLKFF